MADSQRQKGETFRDLHTAEGIFLMPNAWNAGSACMLESAGFPAIGTTSAGIAFCLGLPDYEGALSRDAALEETRRIATAVDVPVSADAEYGYGHDAEDVAESIRLFADAGAVGASIEDFAASYGGALYERSHAAERIRAAKEACESLEYPFSVRICTGRPVPIACSSRESRNPRPSARWCGRSTVPSTWSWDWPETRSP